MSQHFLSKQSGGKEEEEAEKESGVVEGESRTLKIKSKLTIAERLFIATQMAIKYCKIVSQFWAMIKQLAPSKHVIA